jgi:hypothetical protein
MTMKFAVHCWKGATVGAFAAALALVSGCGNAPGPQSTNHGDLTIQLPDQTVGRTVPFDFGEVRSGTSKQVKLTLDNPGTDSIDITTTFENVPNGSFFANAPKSLAAGETADLVLTFSPQQAGDYSGTLVLEHNGPSQTATVNLHGLGQ